MDGFHLANAVLDALGLRPVKGAPETFDVDRFVQHLRRVREEPETTLLWPEFQRELDEPTPAAIAITPQAKLVIVEGNYLLLARSLMAGGAAPPRRRLVRRRPARPPAEEAARTPPRRRPFRGRRHPSGRRQRASQRGAREAEPRAGRQSRQKRLAPVCRGQLAGGLVEDLRVPVDVGRRRRRRHQRHVVERRQQDAAVERVEVDEAVELGVAAGGCLAPVPRAARDGRGTRRGSRAASRAREGRGARSPLRRRASKRSPRAIIRSNASSVRTSASVARVAASESTLAATVPPIPPTSARSSRGSSSSSRSATSAENPYAATGTPPAIGLPIVSRSGSRP